jgi:hypothetical protein
MRFQAMLPALLTGLLAAGCGHLGPVATDGGGTNSAAEYASANGVISEAASLSDEFEVTTYDDGLVAKAELDATFGAEAGVGLPGTDAAIEPAFWFRRIRSHERSFDVEFEHPDTNTVIAHVTVTDRLLGSFNVATRPDTLDGEVVQRSLISKPLADTSIRKAVFTRHRCVRDDDPATDEDAEDRADGYRDGWSRWRLVALSGHEVTSDAGTRAIQSVRLQAGDVDVTVTDPLELKRVRGELIHLPPATPVSVTVQTGDPTDVVVLYTRWGRQRLRLAENGTFEGRFPTPAYFGLRHIAVNALSHGTLFDDVAPYDSKAWGIPFFVGPDGEPVVQN